MDLEELKKIWKEDDKNLELKIKIIENHLQKINIEKTSGEINKIVDLSLLGRNLALVYCLLSLVLAILTLEEIAYSIPALVGGLAMLGSFISHLSIEKPSYKDPLIKLQKAICNFRIHTAAHAKYDMAIVTLWVLTLAPTYLKYFYNISLYTNFRTFSILFLIAFVVLTLIIALSQKMYKENDQKLKNTEAYLAELLEFEKN